MLIQHNGLLPNVHESAYIAPNATVCGDVTIEANTSILFGAVITAESGPVTIGRNCVIMEGAVIRGTARYPCRIGNNVLVGPRAYLTGCEIRDNVFLATGCTIFNGAEIGERSEVRINAVVHIATKLPEDTMIPIGWVAVGNPCRILPPSSHEEIWKIQEKLNFPKVVWNLDRRGPGETDMPEITEKYNRSLQKYRSDRILET